jgi:hypothetical protein
MSGLLNWNGSDEPIYNLNQPHLYFYLLALWAGMFGYSEAAMHELQSLAAALHTVVPSFGAHFFAPLALRATAILVLGPAFIVEQNLMDRGCQSDADQTPTSASPKSHTVSVSLRRRSIVKSRPRALRIFPTFEKAREPGWAGSMARNAPRPTFEAAQSNAPPWGEIQLFRLCERNAHSGEADTGKMGRGRLGGLRRRFGSRLGACRVFGCGGRYLGDRLVGYGCWSIPNVFQG